MFSGIVETTATIGSALSYEGVLKISVARPGEFSDIRHGESICTDGVCLTVENFDASLMWFSLGPETLRVTGWTQASVLNKVVNLERSLRLQDRVHGHLVTGHVDTVAKVLELRRDSSTQFMQLSIPQEFRAFIWAKGSVALNGVSLTVNQVSYDSFTVGLIPETLKRTNLGNLQSGSQVNLEIDNMARGLIHWARTQQSQEQA